MKRTTAGTLAILAGMTASGWGQRATPVPALDLGKFFGEWYQIARLPQKSEKHCEGNAFVLYARAEKLRHFQVVQSCTIQGGSNQIRNQSGVQNQSGDGKLGITFLYFLHHPRLVIAQAADGSWALVGTPNHKQLVLLSRTSTLPGEVEAQAKDQASAQGYNVGKMVDVKQNDTELRKRATKVLSAAPTQ